MNKLSSSKRWVMLFMAVLLVGVWGYQQVVTAEDMAGSETCKMCHEDQFKSAMKTPHMDCEGCHGPGQAHIDAGGDKAKIRTFEGMTAKEMNEICLECHARQKSHFLFNKGLHSMASVACQDCHTSHPTDMPPIDALLKKQGAALCYGCHEDKEAEFSMDRHHPLPDEDDTGCANCHEPHASKARASLHVPVNETCEDCHAEKAGPYIYEHDVSIVEGCEACHTVHGTTNRHLLKYEDERMLCLSCHTVLPGFHGTSSVEGWEHGCTPCHQAIHGSNTDQYLLEE